MHSCGVFEIKSLIRVSLLFSKVEQFIRSKYESKRWAMEGPVPDPATLGDGHEASVPTPASSVAPATSAVAPPPPKRSAIDLLGGAFDDPAPAKAAPTVASSQPQLSQRVQPSAPAAVQPTGRTTAQVNGGGFFDLDLSSPVTSNNTTSLSGAGAGAPRKNNADILSLFGSGSGSSASQPANNFGGTQAQTSSSSLWGNPASSSSGLDAFSSLNLGGGSSNNGFGGAAPSYSSSSNNVTMYPSTSASAAAYPVNNGMTRPSSNSISGGNPWAAPASSGSAAAAPPASSSNNFYSAPPASSSASSGQYGFGSSNSTSASQASTANAGAGATSLDLFSSQDIWGGSGNSTNSSSAYAKPATSDAFGGFSSGATNKNAFDDLWS